jgi:hypothetical protein
MDNHRCALWCWLQSIDLSQKYNILHIDRHFDTAYWPPEVWKTLSIRRPLHRVPLDDYLAAEVTGCDGQCAAFAWDNYLSAFMHFYSPQLNALYIASHGAKLSSDGELDLRYGLPRWDRTMYVLPDEFFEDEYLEWLFEPDSSAGPHKWIVNIDVDYFFYPDGDDNSRRLFSCEYVADLFGGLREQLDKGRIQVVTIALSPGNTGTWDKAREMCLEICGHLNIPLAEDQIRPYVSGS